MGNLLASPVTRKETHSGTSPDVNGPIGNGFLQHGVSSMQGWRVHMEDMHICQSHLYAEELIGVTSASQEEVDLALVSERSGSKTIDTIDTSATTLDGSYLDETNSGEGVSKKAKTNSTISTSNNITTLPFAKHNDNKNIQIHLPNHSLYAVFDGHGGSYAAEFCGINFCRIMSRQKKFVKYARYAVEVMEQERDVSCSCSSSSINNDRSISPSSNSSSLSGEKIEVLVDKDGDGYKLSASSTSQRNADFHRKGKTYLEEALQDTFIDLDRELLCEVRNPGNKDVNSLYGNVEQYEYNSDKNHETETNIDAKNDKDVGYDGADIYDTQYHPPLQNHDRDSGTTACVVLVTPWWIVCANAGDSRAVCCRGGGRPVALSYDHKPDDEAEEQRIRSAGGYVSGSRVEGDLAVSRGLGDFRFKDLAIALMGTACYSSGNDGDAVGYNTLSLRTQHDAATTENGKIRKIIEFPDEQKVSPLPDVIFQTRDGDDDECIIIACDGIWDVMSNHECVRAVSEIFAGGESNLGLVCEALLDQSLELGSKDNMTALIVKMKSQKVGDGSAIKAIMKATTSNT